MGGLGIFSPAFISQQKIEGWPTHKCVDGLSLRIPWSFASRLPKFFFPPLFFGMFDIKIGRFADLIILKSGFAFRKLDPVFRT